MWNGTQTLSRDDTYLAPMKDSKQLKTASFLGEMAKDEAFYSREG